jgi:hypothetical protein
MPRACEGPGYRSLGDEGTVDIEAEDAAITPAGYAAPP